MELKLCRRINWPLWWRNGGRAMSRRTDALAIHCEVKAKVAKRDS